MIIEDILRKDEMITGLIHVGANAGQERNIYALYDLRVLWFEPNPFIFEELVENIDEHIKQTAYEYLVWDRDYEYKLLHLTDNCAESSSALPLKRHKEVWPDVHEVSTETVLSITLNTFFKVVRTDPDKFKFLVLDTQGSELHVLRGATEILPHIKYAMIEAVDFESYEGGATAKTIGQFMTEHGFKEIGREHLFPVESKLHSDNIFYERIN